ncbi:MAG: M56 family metallopeptidase [Bacteroidetes bacterium]|nr:MAG: M56 family metallopeptidase [Bacteroidota bacterium]
MGETNFLQALGWAVLNSLWQMALLWVIYQSVIAVLKNARSSTKSSLAASLLITGFVWFVYTFISIYSSYKADDIAISSVFINAAGNEQLNSWLNKTLPIASVIYLVLLVLPVLHFIRNYRYVQTIRNNGLAKADVQWKIFIRKVASQLGIKKPVHIWISEFVSSPVTIGYLKPVILIPLAAINHLSTKQIEAVLLHELSHIKRYDYLINLIINFIQTILYYNPFVKAFVKTIEREREKSCDEMVMQFQYDSHEYATALLILEKSNRVSRPFVIAALGKKNDLLHRIELILGIHKKSAFSFNRIAGLFAALLCVIGINAMLIMSKPGENDKSVAFTQISSPFYFFTNDKPEESFQTMDESKPDESTTPSVINHAKNNKAAKKLNNKPAPATGIVKLNNYTPVADYVYVNYAPVVVPLLKKYQEVQVQKAIEGSKKVIENVQWKALEKKIAEVYTQNQKEQLKSAYKAQIDKLNWEKLENNLRIAYDKIDWDQVNTQLRTAIAQITLDSLKTVLNAEASQLNRVQEELSANELTGIPDTDITLKEVEQKKQEVNKTLNSLRIMKVKKVIRL